MAAEDIGQIPDKKDGDSHYPSEFNTFKAAIEARATLVQLQQLAAKFDGKTSVEQLNAAVEPAINKADIATDKANQNTLLISKIQSGEILLSPYYTKDQAEGSFQPKGFATKWGDISEKPELFDGKYTSLSGRPEQFSGNYQDLTNKPALFNGSYDSLTNKPEPPDLTDLATKDDLEVKVDHVEGMYLTPNPFTNAYKQKVDQIEDPKYKGRFKSVADLKAAHTGASGAYAYVEIQMDDVLTVQNYIYDAVAQDWTLSVATGTEETPGSVKQKYESNMDTNAFTDMLKQKLDGVATGATKNASDADLKNRKNHTGTSGLSSIENLTDILNGMNTTNDQQNMAISGHMATTSNPHKVTKAQVGLPDADNTSDKNKPASDAVLLLLSGKEPANDNIQAHIAKKDNPHGVTKDQIGLSRVQNTNDLEKELSTAAKTALALKEPANANIQAHISRTDNPHGVTKTQVGLSKVDNTSDLEKELSTAAKAALGLKQDVLKSGTNIKTVGGVSVLGSGDLPLSGLVKTSTANNVTTNEYGDRFEYLTKIIINQTVSTPPANYSTVTTASILPTGVTIDSCSEHYISIRNDNRGITVAVWDNTDRKIVLGLCNTWASGTNVIKGSAFIKLVKYK